MGEHELVGVSATSELCSCGVSSESWLEHLGEVALNGLNAPVMPPQNTPRSEVDTSRTRKVLANLAARQDELREQADAEGLFGFTERVEWLTRMRTRDEHLAWERKWGYTPAVPIKRSQPTLEQLRVAEAWAERMAS
jgi:hypothetical protein